MEWILEESWREKLKDEMDKPYYRELVDKVQEEYKNEICIRQKIRFSMP